MDARVTDRQQRRSQFLIDAQPLVNAYWWIREARHGGRLRKAYRRAAKEKARLAGLGYERELIRLYGLYLKNPRREQRLERVEEWFERPEQLRLF